MEENSKEPIEMTTLLVVDDDMAERNSLRMLLKSEGYRVLTAASGAQALELFEKEQVALTIIDYFMPKMSGEHLIREIRKCDQDAQIILQTAYADQKPARKMLADLDIQAYHDKSEGPDRFLLAIETALKTRKLISSLRNGERLRNDMIANVSHEFRTPLNIISGYSDLLLASQFGELSGEARTAVETMQRASESLNELVNDFLSYAKIESGFCGMSDDQIERSNLHDELERLGHSLIIDKDLSFDVDLKALPQSFNTDSNKFHVILRNLVTNAVKFTGSGGVTVVADHDQDALCFKVIDTGPGIPADQLETIFEPFRQLEATEASSTGGTGVGLGLALCRKLATLLDAKLEVTSEEGVGSTFSLRIAMPSEDTVNETVANDSVTITPNPQSVAVA